MVKSNTIETIVRVRPTPKKSPSLTVEPDQRLVEFNLKKDPKQGYVNNSENHYLFQFNQVLDMDCTQEEVFDNVAKEVVESCLEGYNGTIFAYGQTGSGKTYTITGPDDSYQQRGIIPRTLNYIFQQIQLRTHASYSVKLSYMEIYNDQAYDLLVASDNVRKLEELKKVMFLENENGEFVLKNLSIHRADNQESAIETLLVGDFNRQVAETPMNDASTRSHCIFMIMIEAQEHGKDTKTVSKLHLVDLSGSERTSVTGTTGKLFKESTGINLSLHYLSQVIVALNDKARGKTDYVPYRNSTMTMILRDSIGGNCMTRMIATISAESRNIDESISTCRFAKNVSMIKNTISKNERADPALIIQRLKKEVADLKAEIALLKGGSQKDHLEPDDITRINAQVQNFIKSRDPNQTLMFANRVDLNQCFYHFRHLYHQMMKKGGGAGGLASPGGSRAISAAENSEQTELLMMEKEKLRTTLAQRDHELSILLQFLKKKGHNGATEDIGVVRDENTDSNKYQGLLRDSQNGGLKVVMGRDSEERKTAELNASNLETLNRLQNRQTEQFEEVKQGGLGITHQQVLEMHQKRAALQEDSNLAAPIQVTTEMLRDRNKAFEAFRKSYRRNQAMEESKAQLKKKYQIAKEEASILSELRSKIKVLTNKLEQVRKEAALRGQIDEDNNIIETPEEREIKNQINQLKPVMNQKFSILKKSKLQIQSLEQHIKNASDRLTADFQHWHETAVKNSYNIQPAPQMRMSGTVSTASSKADQFSDPTVRQNVLAFERQVASVKAELNS